MGRHTFHGGRRKIQRFQGKFPLRKIMKISWNAVLTYVGLRTVQSISEKEEKGPVKKSLEERSNKDLRESQHVLLVTCEQATGESIENRGRSIRDENLLSRNSNKKGRQQP